MQAPTATPSVLPVGARRSGPPNEELLETGPVATERPNGGARRPRWVQAVLLTQFYWTELRIQVAKWKCVESWDTNALRAGFRAYLL